MSEAIKKMGIYNALMASAVQFNSAIFRAVVGVLANVPPSTVAIITSIEFAINFLLEVPTGYLADKYGRVPSAILGHIFVILGLSCGYTALLLGGNGPLPETLFILHGIFIGFTKPLISGSVDAFYQDAVKFEEDNGLHKGLSEKSFTLSKSFGKYFTTISVLSAFAIVYVLSQSNSSHHAFVLGIILWVIALIRLAMDYRKLGDRYQMPSPIQTLLKKFQNRKIGYAMFYNTSVFAMAVVIAGYFLISIGREFLGGQQLTEIQTWTLMFLFFMGSQGLGWIIKGYVLPRIILKLRSKTYVGIFYLILIFTNGICLLLFKHLGFFALCAMTLIYGLIYFTATSAIQAASRNMLLDEVDRQDYAMAISLYNMPGFLWIALYSYYLIEVRNGAPTIEEAFITVAVISAVSILVHFLRTELFHSKKEEARA